MLLWLNGVDNSKWDVNENYARELMELFTLGAGRGYGERDVRELARALTGFRNDWSEGRGPHNFRFDREAYDAGFKRVLGKRGRFDWRDAVRLSVRHRKSPSFVVAKLWGYFIPTPPPRGTARALERMYVAQRPARCARCSTRSCATRTSTTRAAGWSSRRSCRPPGMLRAVGRGVDTTAWSWLCDQAGQMLFEPPNVSGWDDTRWLDTATFRARWQMAAEICNDARLDDDAKRSGKPSELVRRAARFWDAPLSRTTRDALERYAGAGDGAPPTRSGSARPTPSLTENALRMLIAVSPDYLTS